MDPITCREAVLFLVFNRPGHTLAALERLRDMRPPRVYVHCDGPRENSPSDHAKVAAVRAVIHDGIDWPCEVYTLFRDSNLGLRRGVYEAICWFFEAEERGIILEDDCVPDPSFFPFCTTLLDRYQHDDSVMHIGGSNLVEDFTVSLPSSYIFSRFSFVWGWASWRRAWQKMTLTLEGLDTFGRIAEYVPGTMAGEYMMDKFKTTRDGRNNSWAYAWFYSILINNGLCIVPCKNLVQNTGVGEEGATNTTTANQTARRAAASMSFPLRHPRNKALDPSLEQRFFFATQKRRARLWLWFLLHRLGLR